MIYISDIMDDINDCIELLSKEGINSKKMVRKKLMSIYNQLDELLDNCTIIYEEEDNAEYLIEEYDFFGTMED